MDLLPNELLDLIVWFCDDKSLSLTLPGVSKLFKNITDDNGALWKNKCVAHYKADLDVAPKPSNKSWKQFYFSDRIKLFPLLGFTTGHSTFDEILKHPNAVHKEGGPKFVAINKINFWCQTKEKTFNRMYLVRHLYSLPQEWQEFGIVWDKSFNQYKRFLLKWNKNYLVEEAPHYEDFQNRPCFTARITSVAKEEGDVMYRLELDFGYAEDAKSIRENKQSVDWAKEYRVTAFYHDKIINNQLQHDSRAFTNEYMPQISNNHFKFTPSPDPEVPVPIEFFSLQTTIPLYPLPLGNLSTAYYECAILALGEAIPVHVGVALEGYVAMPGLGRNSYGYDSEGNVLLESELSPNDAPTYSVGDVVGCGINFVKKSVFFTKNGVLIADKTHSYLEFPVLNLKTLHATVGCLHGCEFSANFGSRPFKFDLLKYQHQYGRTDALEIYSEKILDHVLRVSDDETLSEYSKEDAIPKISTTDYNTPDPSMKLNLFLWLAHYLRDPRPNGYENEQFAQFGFSQLLISSLDLLLSWENNERVKDSMVLLAQSLNLEYEGVPYEDLVMNIYRSAKVIYIENVFAAISVTLTELAETAFTDDKGLWAHMLLAFYQLNSNDLELEHYSKQAAAMSLVQTFNYEMQGPTFTQQDFVAIVDNYFWFVFYVTRSYARQEVILQKNIKLRERLELKLHELLGLYEAWPADAMDIAIRLQEKQASLPVWNGELITEAFNIYPFTFIYAIKNKALSINTKSQAIMYGIFYLKIPVEQFPTEEEYLSEIVRKCEELLPLEKRKELLENLALNISSNNAIMEENALMLEMFGIPVTKDGEQKITLAPHMIKKAFERIDQEIALIDKQIRKSRTSPTSPRSSLLSNSTKNILMAASVLAVAIGGFFWYNRKK